MKQLRAVIRCWLFGHDFHFRRPDGSWGGLQCWFCGREYKYPMDSSGVPYCPHGKDELARN